MDELVKLAKNLRELRKQYGYTQKFIADKIGTSYQAYQAYERGVTVPTLQNFIKLAKLFDVSYDELFE